MTVLAILKKKKGNTMADSYDNAERSMTLSEGAGISKEGGVQSRLNEMDEALEVTQKLIGELGKRLQPVLSQPHYMEKASDSQEGQVSPDCDIVLTTTRQVKYLKQLQNDLVDMMNRVQL